MLMTDAQARLLPEAPAADAEDASREASDETRFGFTLHVGFLVAVGRL